MKKIVKPKKREIHVYFVTSSTTTDKKYSIVRNEITRKFYEVLENGLMQNVEEKFFENFNTRERKKSPIEK